MSNSPGQNLLTRATGRLAVLRLRDLRFVFGATLVSDLGDGVVSVALAFAVLDLTHSATDLGLVLAARTLAQVLVMLIGGVIADRMSRRTVMMAADAGRFGSQVAIGVLLLTGHATVAEIAVSQVLLGIGSSFFIPASSGLIRTVAGDHAQEANALRTIASSGAGLLGPALGGVLVVAVGPSWAMVLDGVSYLLSALLLSRVGAILATLRRDVDAPSFLTDLRGGFREVTSRTWLWSLIVNMAVGNILFTTWPVLGPLICKQHYGGAPAYAALSVVWAAGMLVGGSLLLRFKPRHLLRVAMLASLPWTLPGIFLGLHFPIYVVGLFQFVSAAGITVEGALFWTTMQQNVPAESMSRVTSWDYAVTMSIMPFGYALVGPLVGLVGVSAALIGCSVAVVLVTSTCFLVREIRMLESVPPVASPPPETKLAGAS
ncbi:MAG TPA: MFS transporter [Solirubrobacteraceae bacterium]|nr:MFS transporter [Solirubrobacteraceae bacterium]